MGAMMTKVSLVLFAVALPAAAQQKPQAPPSKELMEVRKKAVEALTEMRTRMAAKGAKAEIGDCDSIIAKLCEPHKPMTQKGAFSPYPGDEAYEETLAAWTELGAQLSGLYREAAASLKDKEQEEAWLFSEWFATWAEVAKGVRHLNRRRKFIGVAPVTTDWSGSLGGFLHGRYLKQNASDPSTAGLGAHNEDPKLPGYTTEGAEAAGGILGGGTSEWVMDSWLGSGFHRDPVFSRTCGRIAFGGLPGGWWSCRNAGGIAGKPTKTVLTFPGDGDTEIPTEFGGEAPNPLPKGLTSAGTFIVIDFAGGYPKKPEWKLIDPDGREVERIDLTKTPPLTFVAKTPLKGRSKYTVEVWDQKGWKHSFSFTTR